MVSSRFFYWFRLLPLLYYRRVAVIVVVVGAVAEPRTTNKGGRLVNQKHMQPDPAGWPVDFLLGVPVTNFSWGFHQQYPGQNIGDTRYASRNETDSGALFTSEATPDALVYNILYPLNS